MIERYTLPEMGRVWSEAHKYELWCRVEVLVLEAHARAGTVPAESVEPVRSAPATHPRSGSRGGGGHRPRRDRLPDRLGRQHHAPLGRRLGALRHDLLRPARHRARGPARRGHRPAGGQGHPAGRGAARSRAGAPGHAAGRPDARHPRRTRHLGAPGGRLRLRHGALPGPDRPGQGRGGGRHAVRPGRQLLQHRPGHRGRGHARPRPARRGRGDPGRDAGRDRRVGRRAGPGRHRLRGGRARGQARAAHRGAGAGRAVPFGPEGLLGHAAQEEPHPFGADRRPGPGDSRLRDPGDRGHPAVA